MSKQQALQVILSNAKNPDDAPHHHNRQHLPAKEPGAPRLASETWASFATAKLLRSKTVILSEAEGPAFLSHHYDASGTQATHPATKPADSLTC